MNQLQKDAVRDLLNGIVIICMIVVISIAFGLIITSPSHASECEDCGCTTVIETFELDGTAL